MFFYEREESQIPSPAVLSYRNPAASQSETDLGLRMRENHTNTMEQLLWTRFITPAGHTVLRSKDNKMAPRVRDLSKIISI